MAAKLIRLAVNGRDETLVIEPFATLQDVLRDTLELTAVKSGCAQGGCGSCAVLVDGEFRLSCLILAERVEGAEVVTLEGLNESNAIVPLQQAFVENHAAQCGYCTAGMIIAAKALLDRNPAPSRDDIVEGRPVKFKYTREEEMQVSSTRSAWRLHIKDGVMNDGRIVARKITSYQDSGAYLRFSSYGSMKHAGHMPGPYTIPNVWVDARVVFTNRPPSSAMRGFGVMAGSFAIKLQMDKVARTIGMDPWQLRLLNAYRNGDMKAHRKEAEDAALVETVQAAARLAGHELPPAYRDMTSWDRKAG